MSQQEFEPRRRRRFSLSVRVSIGLVLAAIIPLGITLLFSEMQTRPALTNQANTAMETDAKTRVQLIDTYIQERTLDALTLSQVQSVAIFMAAPPEPKSPVYQDLATHALFALGAGTFRDKNYSSWQLFTPQGQPLLFYPLSNPPKPHGNALVPPDYLKTVSTGKPVISSVYYTPGTKTASIDIYAPIINPQPHQYLGFMRASLNLNYIWNIVNGDQGANGDGSYAFILDENGVRIADTDPARRFKSVAPIPGNVQLRISQELRYGTIDPVQTLSDSAFASAMHDTTPTTTFQAQPAGQAEQYQVVQQATTTVPWKYYVLSPVNTVTAVANRQLLLTGIVALTMAILAAFVGLIFGRRITQPILNSVEFLRSNSRAMTALATSQQDAASEQMWVVDSSQVGLQSVQYYADATKVAAHQLIKTGTELAQQWGHIDAHTARVALERIVTAAQYIENATQYQSVSNQKLATALKVATQVTEQLVSGTTSATDAATQLEQVVSQLRSVVGK